MKPSFDPAELFPMPNTRGASFETSKSEAQSVSARLLGHARNLPRAKPAGGMSLLAVRTSKKR